MSEPRRLVLHVLGPLRASVDGVDLRLGGGLRPRLLAWLALHRATAVSVDRTVEALWPGTDPGTGRSRLPGLVWATRRAVGADALEITRHHDRLTLDLDGDQVDATRFESVVSRSVADPLHAPERTVQQLTSVLATWRGDPYAELLGDPDGVAESYRLSVLRLDALELLHGLQLILGPPPGLTAAITTVVRADATRETSWRQLMAALQGAGRHVEALRAFHDARRALLDHGLTPSAATRAVERDVIEGHEPAGSLLLPDRRPPRPDSRPAAGWARELIRRWRSEPGGRVVIVTVRDAGAATTARRLLATAASAASCGFVDLDGGPDDPLPADDPVADRTVAALRLSHRVPLVVVAPVVGDGSEEPSTTDPVQALTGGGGDVLAVVVTTDTRRLDGHLVAAAEEFLDADPDP